MPDDAAPFPYLRWAKAHLDRNDARSLGLSGLPRPAAQDVGVALPWPSGEKDAYTAWREAVAAHRGVEPSWIHPACGTSHGNFAVYLAFARAGRVAVETPAYESLPRSATAVGATLRTFRRNPDRGWRIDAADLDTATREGVDLLAVTDLHNPSGARLHADDLDLLCNVADAHDAVVLVDEVYLELDPLDRATAGLRHPRVLVTSSLTKTYGMWDLRAGWVLGEPERIEEIGRWDDLVCPTLAPAPLYQAAMFLPSSRPHLERTRDRARRATEQVDAWVASRRDLTWAKPAGGFTGLLMLEAGRDGDELAKRIWEEEKIRIVPGSFFQMSNTLRISYLLEPAQLDDLLVRVSRVLDAS